MSKLIAIFGILGVFAALSFSGCASKAKVSYDKASYDRANKAASESHKRLNRE